MIARHGVSAVFNTYATQTFDRSTGAVTRGAKTAHTVVVSPPNANGGPARRFGNVDGIREAEKFAIIAASGLLFTPAVGQEFVWDGRTWVVTWVNPLRSAAGVLAFEFGIEGKV
jgi:hypothetical protein